jgi:hypothetical protein
MNPLTINLPGNRGLTDAGETAFIQAYQEAINFEAVQPTIRFSAEASDIYREIARLRMKDWRSTSRWNEAADVTGLLGELAIQRYFNIPVVTAMAEFTTGLVGDRGYDLLWGAERIDVKSTRGQSLKFKFNKQNRNRDKATAYAFVSVQEVGLEVWCKLLGFSYRHEIKPFVRDDGQSFLVRAETLRREGVLYSVQNLKVHSMQEGVTHNV